MLKKLIITFVGLLLIFMGSHLVNLSRDEPQIITPTQWLDQINEPGDVEPPRADRFQQFDPGDILYVEGYIQSIKYYSMSNKTVIMVTDNNEKCSFESSQNYSNINVSNHVFVKLKIIEQGGSEDEYILSGDAPIYFREKVIVIGIDEEVSSTRSSYQIGGIAFLVVGLVFIIYIISFDNRNIRKNTG